MKKRFISLFISVCLLSGILCLPSSAATIDESKYLPAVYLNSPIPSHQVISAAFGVVNGKDYMYTSASGSPGIFNVYNLDDQKLEATYETPGAKNLWNHIVDSEGIVYMASDGLFFRYNPYTKEFKKYGVMVEGEKATFVTTIDENDNIYIGTFPNAKIIKYDKKTDSFEDWGQLVPGATYVRSISYYDGYLYCGVQGDNLVGFYRVDTKNPSKKVKYDIPENPGYYEVKDIEWVYTSTVIGDKIALYTKSHSLSPLLVFDTKNEKFLDTGFKQTFTGLYTSPVRNGKSYFTSRNKLMAIDVATGKVEDLDFDLGVSTTTHAIGWVTLENNPDFPGESLVTVDTSTGCPVFYNVQSKKILRQKDIDLKGGYFSIQSLENGDYQNGDNALYIGAYAGDTATRYDLDTKEYRTMGLGQPEGMLGYEGKQYFGIYTRAQLYRYDHTLPLSGTNPSRLGIIGENQDRPFAMTSGEGKIFAGTIPVYGILGGALGIYDVATGEMEAVNNLIDKQGIMSIAYRDGKIYGSTTIWGGLGATPVAEQAKIFVYDLAAKQLTKEFTPKISGVNKPSWIGSVAFDKNGKLWAITGNTLFSVDPETEAVNNVLKFDDYTYSTTSHTWRPLYIRFDEDGLLYAGIKGIKVVNTETMEYYDLTDKLGYETYLWTIASDGNIYFSKSGQLWMLPIRKTDYQKSDSAKIRNLFSDKLSLVIGNSLAFSNGTIKQIDSQNSKVTPVVENGRTLVPVRFIAESLGAEVDWNDATQTATLKKDSLTISVTLNESQILINGEPKAIDVPAQTKDDRTLLPLRAVSDAFSKQVYWNDNGVIVIGDDLSSVQDADAEKIKTYFDFYIYNDRSEQNSRLAVQERLKNEVNKLNGTVLSIPNSSFEEPFSESDPVPGFTSIAPFTENTSAQVSTDRAFTGKQSLKIVDKSTTAMVGYSSDYIPIDKTKNHTLFTPLYLESGRTSVGIYYYDSKKTLLGRTLFNEEPGTQQWNLLESIIPMTYRAAAYIKIHLYTSEYWVSDCYYDDITLVEY